MQFIRKNYKLIITFLIVLILTELAVSYYLIEKFRENYLSKTEALTVALDRAGLRETDVRDTEIEFKHRDGQAWYEVEFEQIAPPCLEYTYTIDAETGEILFSQTEQ